MPQQVSQDILDRITKVCICKAIPRSKIKASIEGGASTLEEVQKATGAGSGGCGGKRCTPKIQELLEEYNKST